MSSEIIDGRFRLVRLAGEGGMGRVYMAVDGTTLGLVALKVFDPHVGADRSRLDREAEILATLSHARIVRYVARGELEDGGHYIAMEWLEGEDVSSRLARGSPSIEESLSIVTRAAEGLAAAHEAGILHRDVKPSNLFLVNGDPEDVRVIDFGIARHHAPSKPLTATGVLIGTPAYMAPEQVRGVRELTPRVDVFSLGVVLFECLCGRRPFVGDHDAAVLAAILSHDAPRPSVFNPQVPPALDDVVLRMLQKRPENRLDDAAAVALALGAVAAGGLGVPEALGWEEKPTRSSATADTIARGPTLHLPTDRAGGRSTVQLLGRAREISTLVGTYDETLEGGVARAALMSGPSGMGKSRLARELARRLAAHPEPPRILSAAPDRGAAGDPFAVVVELLRTAYAIPPAASSEAQRALLLEGLGRDVDPGEADDLLELFAHLIGCEVSRPSPRLEAARRDALLMGDLLRSSFETWVGAMLRAGPIAVVLDSIESADPISLRFLERAARRFEDQPFVVYGFGRPEAFETYPDLFGAITPVCLTLEPLRPRPAAQLVSGLLGGAATASVIDRIVELGRGNPLHLVELARTYGERGEEGLSGSLPQIVASRLEALSRDERLALRAASVFGERFWTGGVARLLGRPEDLAGVGRLVAALERQRIVKRAASSRIAGETEHEIPHAPVRDTAYALLTDHDRAVGHRLAGDWLVERGWADAAVIARHYEDGQARDEAHRWYRLAAERALSAQALDRALELSGRALSIAREPEDRAALLRVRAEASFFRGALEDAAEAARDAADQTQRGAVDWFDAAALHITAEGQRGRNDEVAALLAAASEVPALTGADNAKIVCLCRGVTQLLMAGGAEAAREVADRVEGLAEGVDHSPLAHAFLHRMRGAFHLREGRLHEAVDCLAHAVDGYERIGDPRGTCLVRVFLGSVHTWLGEYEQAEEVLSQARAQAARIDAPYLDTWALYAHGKVAAERGDVHLAQERLDTVVRRSEGSPRVAAGAHIYLALAWARAGRSETAEEQAMAALARHDAPTTRAAANAALALARLGRDQPAAALEAAREGHQILDRLGTIEEFATLVRLAFAEALHAAGETDAARATIAEAYARLQDDAARIADPVRRDLFRTRPPVNARTVSLAHAWGGLPERS